MVHYCTQIIGGVPGATMWKDAIDAASIKIADFESADVAEWDPNIAFAAQCHAQGLPIEAWAYVYGSGGSEAKYLWRQYEKLLAALAAAGVDPALRPRYTLDAEVEYERNASMGFLDAMGDGHKEVELAPMVMPMMPYRNRLALGAIENFGPVAPMLYWLDFSDRWRDWNVLIPDWEYGPFGRGWSRGFTEAAVSFYGQPVAPTLTELQAFVEVLRGHGVTTCYWWQWQGAPESFWLWLRARKASVGEPGATADDALALWLTRRAATH